MKKNNISHLICSLTHVNDYSLVFISGSDSKMCLQNQLTINMDFLKIDSHVLCAHCNHHGKVLSVLRLFHYQNGYIYIQKKSISNDQIKELKKYTIFYDIQIITLSNYFLFGISGLNARRILSVFFSDLPNMCKPVIFIREFILLWFQDPEERFLLIAQDLDLINLKKNMLSTFFIIEDNTWNVLDIAAGIPYITKKTSQKFLPQEINLDLFHGIDYQKGCYLGQEIISRVYFKRIKTRKLHTLLGISNITPSIFSAIEMNDGILWKKVGFVFFVLRLKDHFFFIQCMLNNKVHIKNVFRLSVDPTSRFRFN
ncbi:tRNA-modifying protein YgfZ [Buchnera aphidicola]|uniref:tRNA-modifying protein YgfZ n=1 Tax=Buchnera aphidicola TaxID=9 RepID=UPI003463FB01